MNRNYNLDALNDAIDMAQEFAQQIADALIETGDVYPLDLDGLDEFHHESHVDKAYSLLEAATILDQVENETDWGLWQGLEPREAISAQAAYSYGNAVLERFDEIVAGLQTDDRVRKILDAEDDENLTLPLRDVILSILPEFRPSPALNQEKSAVETRKTIGGWQYRVCGGEWRGMYGEEENAIAAAQTWMRG